MTRHERHLAFLARFRIPVVATPRPVSPELVERLKRGPRFFFRPQGAQRVRTPEPRTP